MVAVVAVVATAAFSCRGRVRRRTVWALQTAGPVGPYVRLIACLLLIALMSTACSQPATTVATEPTAKSSVSASSDLAPAAAYQLLVADVVGFVAKAEAAERLHPDASPSTAEEVLELTDYRFAEGVELVTYSDEKARICFTGPKATYLTFTEPESGDDLVLSLGGGSCAYGDGEVVVTLFVPEGSSTFALESRVDKGDEIAAGVPALDDFVELLNANTTVTTEAPTS